MPNSGLGSIHAADSSLSLLSISSTGLMQSKLQVFTLFASAPAMSSAFLFSSLPSFLPPNRTGGFASEGVGNVNGLGRTALFSPPRPQLSQSLNIPLGDARSDCSIYREGKAETGVSILLLLLLLALFLFSVYALLFCCDVGGGGLAKGFGGPDAPAESSADADGDGGGSRMPLWLRSGFAERLFEAPPGEPEPDSFSSDSEGMVRLSFGLAAPFEPPVSLLFGVANSVEADVVVIARGGCAAEDRAMCEEGCDVARGGGLISGGDCFRSSRLGGSGAPKKTLASTEPPSSIGVNMLCDLDDACFRSGGDGGRRVCCSG